MSDTQQRIDNLVKSNDVVLFMKGSASFPMCGFSGRAVQILKACGVDPKALVTVNVLDDDGIREMERDWPGMIEALFFGYHQARRVELVKN